MYIKCISIENPWLYNVYPWCSSADLPSLLPGFVMLFQWHFSPKINNFLLRFNLYSCSYPALCVSRILVCWIRINLYVKFWRKTAANANILQLFFSYSLQLDIEWRCILYVKLSIPKFCKYLWVSNILTSCRQTWRQKTTVQRYSFRATSFLTLAKTMLKS